MYVTILLKQELLNVQVNFKIKSSGHGKFSQFDVDFSTSDME